MVTNLIIIVIVCRDNNSSVITSPCKNKRNVLVLVAEVITIREALRIMRNYNMDKIVIRSDLQFMINSIKGSIKFSCQITNKVMDIRNLKRNFDNIQYSYCNRCQRNFVDKIGKRSHYACNNIRLHQRKYPFICLFWGLLGYSRLFRLFHRVSLSDMHLKFPLRKKNRKGGSRKDQAIIGCLVDRHRCRPYRRRCQVLRLASYYFSSRCHSSLLLTSIWYTFSPFCDSDMGLIRRRRIHRWLRRFLARRRALLFPLLYFPLIDIPVGFIKFGLMRWCLLR